MKNNNTNNLNNNTTNNTTNKNNESIVKVVHMNVNVPRSGTSTVTNA